MIKPVQTPTSEMINTVNSDEFYAKGKESGKWVEIPPEVREQILAAPDGAAKLSQFEAWAAKVNEVLGNSELTEAERKEFLQRFFNWSDPRDFTEEDDSSTVGRILAGLMAGDPEAIDDVTGGGHFVDLDLADMKELDETFGKDFRNWRDENGIQRPKDQAGIERLNKMFGQQRKKLDEYEDMTIAELVAAQNRASRA